MMRPTRYAEGTDVPPEKTRGELESLLIRHGATGFLSGWADNRAFVQFMLNGRMLRYQIARPDEADYLRTGARSEKTPDNSAERCRALADAEHRRRWRALLLIIKAKLEIVRGGDSTFDREFLADIMLPQGGTVGEQLIPQIAEAYATGTMPKLLGAGS
jgi:hypothetical protein